MQLTRRCVQARSLLQTVVPLCAVPRPAPLCRTLTSCTARLSSSHAGDEFAGASTPLSLPPAALFVTTRETITGRVIVRDLGLVAASAVRSRNLAVDMWVALTRIFGGTNTCDRHALRARIVLLVTSLTVSSLLLHSHSLSR